MPDYPRTAAWLAHQAALVKDHLPYLTRTLLTDTTREVSHLLARRDVAELPRGVMCTAICSGTTCCSTSGG